MRGAYRVLVSKPEGKVPLERPRCRREDNVKMDHEIGPDSVDWIDVAQDKDKWRSVVNAVLNFSVFVKCVEFLDYPRPCCVVLVN
jgi:hypothetical protein